MNLSPVTPYRIMSVFPPAWSPWKANPISRTTPLPVPLLKATPVSIHQGTLSKSMTHGDPEWISEWISHGSHEVTCKEAILLFPF